MQEDTKESEYLHLKGLPIFQVQGGDGECRRVFRRRLRDTMGRKLLVAYLGQDHYSLSPGLLRNLAICHDLVVVEAQRPLPLHTIVLGASPAGGQNQAAGVVLEITDPASTDWNRFCLELFVFLDGLVRKTPVWGCVLIGGKSSRMGRPKHLLVGEDGRSWLGRAVELLMPLVDGVVVAGGGRIPDEYRETLLRLPDIGGVKGPLAGVVSAGRWLPCASWLVVACDMPVIRPEAVQWLLAGRQPGCWGRVPVLPGEERPEPLFAWYDSRAMALFEGMVDAGISKMSRIVENGRIHRPRVPESLRESWANVNTPEQLSLFKTT